MHPYQGSCVQTDAKPIRRVLASRRFDATGTAQFREVLWAEVNAKSNIGVGAAVRAPVSEVVDAIHTGHDMIALFETSNAIQPERAFAIVDHSDGRETITLDGLDAPGRELQDLATLPS